jgi:monoamine oxidase
VIIIGAGAAGLAAARKLSVAGLRLLIVEARPRAGGRIDTLHDPGWPAPIERGAEFIHGQPTETWDIIRAAGLAAYDIAEVRFQSNGGRIVRRDDFWEQIESVFARLKDLKGEDQSFAEFLAQHCGDASADAKKLAVAYVEGLNAADQHVISAQSLTAGEQEEEGRRLCRLLGGQDQLIQWLRAGMDPKLTAFRFNSVVTKVNWRHRDATVHTQSAIGEGSESLHAARALITLPLGVLTAPPGTTGAVQFQPDLPEKWKAVSQLRMGPVVKVILRFQEAFWDTGKLRELGFLYSLSEAFSPWWTLLPVRVPVLTGWAGGPAAERLSEADEADVLKSALGGLSKSLKIAEAELLRLLQDWHVCNWQADPYSRGAYTYMAVGGAKAPEQLGSPVDDTLFFAGEATSADLMGTVAGAIASGYRAADEVLAASQSTEAR